MLDIITSFYLRQNYKRQVIQSFPRILPSLFSFLKESDFYLKRSSLRLVYLVSVDCNSLLLKEMDQELCVGLLFKSLLENAKENQLVSLILSLLENIKESKCAREQIQQQMHKLFLYQCNESQFDQRIERLKKRLLINAAISV
jgi:hypothetical protein